MSLGVSSDEVAAESERGPLAGPEHGRQSESTDKPKDKPERKHPGRQKLPSHLARVEQIIACSAEQCTCGQCGQQTQVIGYEETEVLDVRPAEYFVRVIKREKRACKQCAEQGVRTAGAPERIAPKSLLSDHFIIDLVVGKYCESLPIYRQQVDAKPRWRRRHRTLHAERCGDVRGRVTHPDGWGHEARPARRPLYTGR